MVNRQQLEGKWNEIKGKLKEKWGTLTDDELSRAEGNVEQLVGMVQRKTGRAKEEVEKFIDDVVNGSGSAYERVAATASQVANQAREYAGEAGQAVQQGYQQAAQSVQQGYEQAAQSVSAGYQSAEETVRHNPMEAIAVSFGVGLISGVLVGLMLKNR